MLKFYLGIYIPIYRNMKIFLSVPLSPCLSRVLHILPSLLCFLSPSLTCPAAFDYKQLLFTDPPPTPNQFDCVQSRLDGPHAEEDVKDREVRVWVHTDTPSVQRISLLYESVKISERGHVRGN